jgi:hypothetical protein
MAKYHVQWNLHAGGQLPKRMETAVDLGWFSGEEEIQDIVDFLKMVVYQDFQFRLGYTITSDLEQYALAIRKDLDEIKEMKDCE